VLPLQTKPVLQSRFVQHACPPAPHCTQLLVPLQTVDGAVHVLFGQHASPAAPQLPHAPFAHIWLLIEHVAPDARQTLFTQQPPLPHVLSAQHAFPAAPHVWQTPAPPPEHTVPAAQIRPGQHVVPAAPHC
jgi:hypothetical protein